MIFDGYLCKLLMCDVFYGELVCLLLKEGVWYMVLLLFVLLEMVFVFDQLGWWCELVEWLCYLEENIWFLFLKLMGVCEMEVFVCELVDVVDVVDCGLLVEYVGKLFVEVQVFDI